MTAPVTVAAPAARTTPASPGGGSADSAAPFASALDGALGGPVRDAASGSGGDRQASGDPATGTDGEATEEVAVAPPADSTAASVAATLWVLGLAAGAMASGTPATPAPGAGAEGGTLASAVPGVDALPASAAQAAAVPAPPTGGPQPATTAVAAVTAPPAPAGDAPPPGLGAPAPGGAPAAAPASAPAAATGAVVQAAAVGPVLVRSPDGPAAQPGAPAPSAGAVPAAAEGGVGPVLLGAPLPVTAGAGEAAADGGQGTGHGPAQADPAPVADGATGVVPSGPAAAPGPPTATATAAVGEPDVGAPAAQPVSGQVARQVAVLSGAGSGSHTLTMVLNPENLGPVEVQVTVAQGSLDLHLRGAHDLGRAALLDALPELRRDLEAAGLSPSRVEVDPDTGGSWLSRHAAEQQAQQGSGGDRGAQQDRTGERSRSWGQPADRGEGPVPPTHRSTSSGVDVRV